MSTECKLQEAVRTWHGYHFSDMMLERYGVEGTVELERELLRQIWSYETTPMGKRGKRTVHLCTLPDGRPVRVVYSKEMKCMVTALPLNEESGMSVDRNNEIQSIASHILSLYGAFGDENVDLAIERARSNRDAH